MRKIILIYVLMFFAGIGMANAQITVTGRILDESDNKPIPFASIAVVGTNAGTISNEKGEFKITLSNSANELTVSFLGYTTQQIKVGASKELTVFLKRENQAIEEVVVTGFQTLKKSTFTGSSVKISADDMQLRGETDVSRMLEGKAAGVVVQNVSGTFGAAPKVRVRGVTSISGENKPLWVVDGVVLEDVVNISNDQLSSGDPTTLLGSSVAGINSNDIETFDVLKDAAATALYGARAMNGVIVITTKRGKSGAPIIKYSGNYTMRSIPTYNQFNIMNSVDQISVFAEMERKSLLEPSIGNEANSGVYGIMYKMLETIDPSTGQFLLQNTPEARKAFLLDHARSNTDWFNMLFKNTIMHEHTLSVTSGGEKSKSYISLGFLNDGGWTIADKVKRYTMNARNDFKLSDKIDVAFQIVGSLRTQSAPGSLGQETNRVSGTISREFDINPFSYALNTSRLLRPYDNNGNLEYYTMNYAPFNILKELDSNKIKLNVADIKAQGEFNYKIVKGLKFNFTGAVRYVKSKQEHEIHEQSNMANAYRAAGNATIRERNPYLYKPAGATEGIVVLPSGGFYNTQENELFNFDIRNSFTYNAVWNDTHEFNVLLGQQIKYTDRKYNENTGYGFQYDLGGTVATDPMILKQMIESNFPYFGRMLTYDRFAAFYANADYTYDRRYSVSATVRYDGSNSMGSASGSRWLPTWNFSGKWNIAQEKFLLDVPFLDALSLRASYGLTASMPPISNATAVFVNGNTTRPGGDIESAIEIYNLANKELTWEKSYQTNFGFDLTMFRGRFDFSFDYFIRNSFDLISSIKTSGIGGEYYKFANVADLRSSGYDFTIGGKPVMRKDFNWSVNFTFGFSKNEITRSDYEPNIMGLVRSTGGNKRGYPVNSIFSIPFAGLNPENGLPMFYNSDRDVVPDADFQSTGTDYLKYEGSVDPKFTGGFNNTFTYKNLSLNVFFTYQAGNVVRLYPFFSNTYSDSQAMPREMFARWTLPGDETNTNIPSIASKMDLQTIGSLYPYNAYNYSDQRIAKGDFIRLKSLSVGYDLPDKWLKSWHTFSSASIRFSAKNLWLLYADKKLNGQDPEFANIGGVSQPIQKQFILTLDLSF